MIWDDEAVVWEDLVGSVLVESGGVSYGPKRSKQNLTRSVRSMTITVTRFLTFHGFNEIAKFSQ